MIIAQKEFRDEEYFVPKRILEDAGVKVVTASINAGSALGKLGGEAQVDISINSADIDDYHGIVFIGGGGAEVYFENETAHALAREARDEGKIVAAICIAPSILANAGILIGKHATAYQSQKKNLEDKGALWTGIDLEVDGRIITANGPDAAKKFGEVILGMVY